MSLIRKLSVIIIAMMVAINIPHSQNNKDKNKQPSPNSKKGTVKVIKQTHVPDDNQQDYKIISSNSSFIELEYYPAFNPVIKIYYNGESFDEISFDNSGYSDNFVPGSPDIKSRLFPVFLPSMKNNTISLIDYDVKEVKGINLVPQPGYRLIKSPYENFEDIGKVYLKDNNYFGKNKFFPENIAVLSEPHSLRENIVSNIIIHPYSYNPVSGILKLFTRIRIRVTFGSHPVLLNRTRSLPEIELLKGSAINSGIAINWKNPDLKNQSGKSGIFNSEMNTGDWYKIEIKDDGQNGSSDAMYKITKSFLQNAGINVNGLDPRTIKIYGNGGMMLPRGLDDPRPVDLVELPVFISGEEDGHFDDNDYIVFYGSSVNNWGYDSLKHRFTHCLSIYSGSNFYWLCLNTPGHGKRMPTLPPAGNQNLIIPTSFTEKLFYEPEISNLLNEGNIWLSKRLSNNESIIWNNALTGLENNTNILYRFRPASRVFIGYSNHMLLKEVNSTVSDYYQYMSTVEGGWGAWIWTPSDTPSFSINSNLKTNGEQSSFRMTFMTSDPSGEGYLDWMEIQYRRRLNSVSGDFMRIVDTNSQSTIEYNVSSFSGNQIKVFDASNHDSVSFISPSLTGSNSVRFRSSRTGVTKYFVIGPNGYKTPTAISERYQNQNLHGIQDGADFIIITHKEFLNAANRLKEKREAPGPGNPDYLKTMVIDIDKIYNEFSGGVLDPVAIRDFIKYAYENWPKKPAFVCLFGDGSFDYKNIYGYSSNFIPSFEICDVNISQISGYAPDDYFVMVTNNDVPDLAIGRIPANNTQQADGYINKISCYEDNNYNGYWKNNIIYVADDGITVGGGDDGEMHTAQSELLANEHTPEFIDPLKLYLIAYPAIITPQGRRKPGVNDDIIKFWNKGALAVHYVGHGAPDVWAHEYVLEKNVIVQQLNNKCRYPFLSVASCDFGKFDNPVSTSGAEDLMIAVDKGAIGSLAATRPTEGPTNSVFMNRFWTLLYFQSDTLLLKTRFGTACFQTKQVYHSLNDLKFVLLGDPTIRTRLPRFQSRVDSISGLSGDTMRALSKIKVYGSIMNPDSTLWSGYNGKIFMKIFDATKHVLLTDEYNLPFHFSLPGGIIYSGTQNVKNGLWAIEFIVPKDLSYQDQYGKLINYFYNNNSDGSGLFKDFIVGGINPDAAIDTTGPLINLFLNDRNFRSGDVVNENFSLLVDLFDESGINTTGTIGHKIEATLNDEIANKIDLTVYYNSDTTYKTGHISYAMTGFSNGNYKLSLTAWDTYDNSSKSEIFFTVSSAASLRVSNVYNIPNPFKDNTVFTFQHNYPDPINAKIKIYTVAGRLIKEIDRFDIGDKFVSIPWDGHDADGDRLSNGVYIYKLTVETGKGNSIVNTGKLAVLR